MIIDWWVSDFWLIQLWRIDDASLAYWETLMSSERDLWLIRRSSVSMTMELFLRICGAGCDKAYFYEKDPEDGSLFWITW
ncbi:unnamed protein product [Blepharisma stoltei]|uniref:Uncharacterized protein n=1 Tax=Blepharisma stoltei TaxID=1481888 RepID=A0AAU9KCW0_9CILI|nr:unnamed protein product [Blepharisma stoltei]